MRAPPPTSARFGRGPASFRSLRSLPAANPRPKRPPRPTRPLPNTAIPPKQHSRCVKVGVSQVRKSGCLLTAGHASISGSIRPRHASISGWDDPGMRPLRLRTPGACVYFRFGKTSMRPLRAGHASIPESAESRLASIAESAEPACVQFPKGMRLFPGRLNASLRLFQDRMSRACVHFAFGQASMRPFPPGHASISASAERELASISGSANDGDLAAERCFDESAPSSGGHLPEPAAVVPGPEHDGGNADEGREEPRQDGEHPRDLQRNEAT